ncbi:S49 family peptidase [Asaia astilbis]|uniref:S49 family peptidase n=1 Tax=Asaia astilbis TaxID=610244 RepID=UPI0004727AFA|nr:S49 family peptidase [Asaia astilbis]
MVQPSLFLNRPIAFAESSLALLRLAFESGGSAVALLGERLSEPAPYEVIKGIAIIPVTGMLLPGSGLSWSEATYYQDIRQSLEAALEDPAVRSLALLVNSPGGTVSQCFDTAELIYQARGSKPIWAILDDAAYSAAYAIASAADFITVPRTGGTGSIGVVGMHLDVTASLADAGIKVTTFQFGERKTDSYPTTAMTEPARTRMQADIDELGEMFVALVARNRNISPESVRNTQAATFLGEKGVALGLADRTATPQEAISALLKV